MSLETVLIYIAIIGIIFSVIAIWVFVIQVTRTLFLVRQILGNIHAITLDAKRVKNTLKDTLTYTVNTRFPLLGKILGTLFFQEKE